MPPTRLLNRPAWTTLTAAALAFLLAPCVTADTTWYGYRGEPEYNNLFHRDPTNDSELLPININNSWGLADQTGYVIALPRYEWTDYGYDGLSRAMLDGKTGFIRGDGDWYIEPVFDWVDRFAGGYAVFRQRGRYGLIDRRGEVALKPELEGLLRFRENVAAAMHQGRVGFLNKAGNWSIPPTFAVARSFHEGFAAVRFLDDDGLPGDWGFIDRRGEVVWRDTKGVVTELHDFNDGLAAFRVRDGQDRPVWGYLDKRFEVFIEPKFSRARDYTNGVAAVAMGSDGWGFIDRTGDWTIRPEFDDADDFDTRLAMIRHEGLFGYIDREGRTGIYPQFRRAEPFQFDVARVSREDSFAYIGPAGSVRWDPLLREDPGLRHRGLVDRDRIGRGLIDKTIGGQARRTIRSGGRQLGYDTLLYPRFRGQVAIPYEPEHLYEERMPPRARAGLLITPPVTDEESETPDNTEIVQVDEPDVVIELDADTPETSDGPVEKPTKNGSQESVTP